LTFLAFRHAVTARNYNTVLKQPKRVTFAFLHKLQAPNTFFTISWS
jgi:hypothetical protein